MKSKIDYNEHKQSYVHFLVDEKIKPVIQYVIDNYPAVMPYASCQGNESGENCYIMFLVRDINQFHNMCELFGIKYSQYQLPAGELGNVPSWRISIPNLDYILDCINPSKTYNVYAK